MSEMLAFLKSREPKKHVKFAACAEWKDEKGKTIEWELKPLETEEINKIRAKATRIKGGKSAEFDSELFNRLVTSHSVVYPNLNEATLADYLLPNAPLDQRKPENLICLILRDDMEYQALFAKVAELNGWNNDSNEDLVEIAKN